MDIAKLHTEGRKFTTKRGHPVRILCTDKEGDYPVVALVDSGNGYESLHLYTERGTWGTLTPEELDLVLVPVEQVRYCLLHKESGAIFSHTFFLDRSDAENIRQARSYPYAWRIAKITWEE